MKPKLHIIASCTDRKSVPVPDALKLRNFRGRTLSARCEKWSRALARAVVARVPALDLYAGDHWAVVRDVKAVAEERGWNAYLWVASAGYGLIPAEAKVAPYAATFALAGEDCVSGGRMAGEGAEQWWTELCAQPGPQARVPRSIEQLAREESSTTIMIIASPRYLRALDRDLTSARVRLTTNGGELVVLSSPPGPHSADLKRHWIPSVAQLHSVVGGSLISLHARVARHMLVSYAPDEFSVDTLRKRYSKLGERGSAPPRPKRTTGTDAQVMAFIRRALRNAPELSHSRLLREYRDSGFACEQGRFRTLVQGVRGLS